VRPRRRRPRERASRAEWIESRYTGGLVKTFDFCVLAVAGYRWTCLSFLSVGGFDDTLEWEEFLWA
jgi:hypothetical protein